MGGRPSNYECRSCGWLGPGYAVAYTEYGEQCCPRCPGISEVVPI